MSMDLLKIIKKAAVEAVEASNPTAILFGKVIKTSPLNIMIEQKMTLTQEFLVLTKNVSDYTVEMAVNANTDNTDLSVVIEGQTVSLKHKHKLPSLMTVLVKNGLKVNDNVILMRIQGGQKYLVLDKII